MRRDRPVDSENKGNDMNKNNHRRIVLCFLDHWSVICVPDRLWDW